GLERALLMQTDPGGNPLLVRFYADANGATRIFADGMDIDATGNIVLSGRVLPIQGGGSAMHVTRLDAAFNPGWTQTVARTTPAFAGVHGTFDNDITACGTTAGAPSTQAVLTRFDVTGLNTLSRQYGAANISTEGHAVIRPVRRLVYALAGRTAIPPNN